MGEARAGICFERYLKARGSLPQCSCRIIGKGILGIANSFQRSKNNIFTYFVMCWCFYKESFIMVKA